MAEVAPCIVASNLSMLYPKADSHSLKDVSISVNCGDRFGILGPNGAGKTTLISILCGLLPPTSGQYLYKSVGRNLTSREIKQQLGFVPQDFAFYEELTPMQNMQYFGSFYHLKKNEIDLRCEEIFDILGITHVSHKKIKTFSGGMKRRMNLAIGIVHKPAVLFLDEPTVGADVQSKHAMLSYIKKLNAEGTTVVYTSHHLSEAQDFCNRIALLNHGEIITCGTLQNLLEEHNATNLKALFIKLTGTRFFDTHE